MPTIDLTGKAAVVTGSGRGLGLAYAHALAAHGASVVVNDIDEDAAEQAVKSITEAGAPPWPRWSPSVAPRRPTGW